MSVSLSFDDTSDEVGGFYDASQFLIPKQPQKLVGYTTRYNIIEDFVVFKVVSCIPILGAFTSMIARISLQSKILRAEDLGEKIELMKVRNDYLTVGVIRNVIHVALMVGGLAAGILNAIGIVLVAWGLGLIYFYNNAVVRGRHEVDFLSGHLPKLKSV